MNRWCSRVMLTGIFLIIAGCGDSNTKLPKLYKAKGIVTKNGKALPNVEVRFENGPDNTLVITGKTDNRGEFVLSTTKEKIQRPGVPEGTYTVTLLNLTDAKPKDDTEQNPQSGEPITLPDKYTVEAKDNEYSFEFPAPEPKKHP